MTSCYDLEVRPFHSLHDVILPHDLMVRSLGLFHILPQPPLCHQQTIFPDGGAAPPLHPLSNSCCQAPAPLSQTFRSIKGEILERIILSAGFRQFAIPFSDPAPAPVRIEERHFSARFNRLGAQVLWMGFLFVQRGLKIPSIGVKGSLEGRVALKETEKETANDTGKTVVSVCGHA